MGSEESKEQKPDAAADTSNGPKSQLMIPYGK